MKQLTYILLLIVGVLQAQYTQIPDASFEGRLINLGYDDTFDGQVLTANIVNVTTLSMSFEFITDLTGIQDFAALEYLDASDNYLTAVDLSQNTNLVTLEIHRNELVNLDLTGNPNLESVICFSQWDGDDFTLINVDVSQCYNLIYLDLQNNDLLSSNINVSNSPNLEYLDVAGANIVSLDVNNNTQLKHLNIANTYINDIDLDNNINLEFLDIAITAITNIDLTNNINLEILWGGYLNLDGLDITNNTNLTDLSCIYCNLNELDLTNNINLVNVYCQQNNITSLNLNNCTVLERFDAGDNELTSFSVRNGNNDIIRSISVNSNYDLTCVEVDDANAAINNLYPYNQAAWGIPSWMEYSNNCSALAVDDNVLKEQLSIYPNPANAHFSIHNDTNSLISNIAIYNQLGMLVKKTNHTVDIDISQLEKGVYFIKMETPNTNSITKQLIKS